MPDATPDQATAYVAEARAVLARFDGRGYDTLDDGRGWNETDVAELTGRTGRLLAAVEAVLAKADSWQRYAVPGDVGYDDAQAFREAITRELLGKGDGHDRP